MTYKEKAKILNKYFSIYGIGNFDLSLEEIEYIIQLLCEKKEKAYLDIDLKELYERLKKTRLG